MLIQLVTKTHTHRRDHEVTELHGQLLLMVVQSMIDLRNYFGQHHQLHLRQTQIMGDLIKTLVSQAGNMISITEDSIQDQIYLLDQEAATPPDAEDVI